MAFFDQKHELTPLEKCDFKDFETFSFYSQKGFQALAFFDQKHELTPLEKCDFKDFETFSFYSQKGFFFSAKSVSFISSLVLTENKQEKSGIFFTKSMG